MFFWKKYFFYVCTGLLLLSFNGFSQIRGEIQAKILTGTIIPHHSSIAFLLNEYQKGIELQYKQKAKHTSQFDSLYRFPKFGIAYQHISLGNMQQLGYASNCFALMDILMYSHKKTSIGFEQNLGVSYVHTPLDISPYNTAISNHINFHVGIDVYYEYTIRSHHTIRTSIELSHISNGKIKTPNLGLNSATLGIAYSYTPYNLHNSNLTKQRTWYRHTILTGIHGSYKSDDFLSKTKYPVATALLEYQYRISAKYGVLLGGNGFYDQSHFALKPLPDSYSTYIQNIEYGIHSGLAAHYNNMSIYICMGKYFRTTSNKPSYFSRVGIRYSFPRYFINFSIKSHKTTADFLECGLGVYIFKAKKQ